MDLFKTLKDPDLSASAMSLLPSRIRGRFLLNFFAKFLCLYYFSSLIFNKTDKGFDDRVKSLFP